MYPKEIITNRLILKCIEDEDYDSFIKMATDPLICKSYMFPILKTDEEKHNLFSRLKTISQDRIRFLYGIYLNNELIGAINEVLKKDDTIEVGYYIASDRWNNGYASEALKAVIDMLFNDGFKSIKAAHFVENHASGKVMMHAGMKKTEEVEDIEYRGVIHKCLYYEINK